MFAVALPALTQNKVVVGRGAHCIKHISFVWNLELFVLGEHLAEAEVMAAQPLYIMFLQGPLDHLGGVVLAGQQYTLVDVAVVATLHTDPHDAGVSPLLVVDRQRGLGRGGGTAGGGGRRSVWSCTRGAAVVWWGGAAGVGGGSRGG